MKQIKYNQIKYNQVKMEQIKYNQMNHTNHINHSSDNIGELYTGNVVVGAKNFSPSRRLGCDDIQTSFLPNPNNKTTSVAGEWTYNQPHYLINIPNNQGNNEVMRSLGGVYLQATEVVLSGKSGGNEVLFPMNKVSSLRDLGERILSCIRKLTHRVNKVSSLRDFLPMTAVLKGHHFHNHRSATCGIDLQDLGLTNDVCIAPHNCDGSQPRRNDRCITVCKRNAAYGRRNDRYIAHSRLATPDCNLLLSLLKLILLKIKMELQYFRNMAALLLHKFILTFN
jgi:hypothetical protein